MDVKIPRPNVPFVAANGRMSTEWFYWAIAMYARTGGAQGISAAELKQQIFALFVTEAMSDDLLTLPPSFSVLLDDAFAADPLCCTGVNLLLAADLMSSEGEQGPPGAAGMSLLPLVNGDLPGPAAIADPYGQFIGVPV